MSDYAVLLHGGGEDAFWAEVPSLPGCFGQGETLQACVESIVEGIALITGDPFDTIKATVTALSSDERLTIYANSDVSRGKFAAAAVHAALEHYGISHGAVIVLGARAKQIEELVVHDAGLTEVKPGTATAGVARGED